MLSESCPYCGQMTSMVKEQYDSREILTADGKKEIPLYHWVSGICEHCKKDLATVASNVPELVDEKPDLRAPDQEVLP